MLSDFFINRLVFGGDFPPIKVLSQARTACNDNAITSAKESAVNSDYNGATRLDTRTIFLILVEISLNGFLGLAILIR
jgi:hypothetical protein